jgi:choline dehydrogenase-like flavoprotein
VDWRLGELEARTVAAMVRTVAGEFERLGAGRVEPRRWALADPATAVRGLRDCYHHMGTTRMSAAPAEGVVDRDCRVHGIANLYVTGSSVFPTSGWAHPTFTAIALSQRLADHLRHGPRG